MTEVSPATPPARRWFLLNGLSAVVALMSFVALLLPSLGANRTWTYAAGEWLLNYGGGFLRRGLGGWLLQSVPGVPERYALVAVVSLLFASVVVLFAVLVGWVMRSTGSWLPLLLWLVPGGPLLGVAQAWWQPYPRVAAVFAFRKEYLGYALVLGVAVALVRLPIRSPRRLIVVAAAAGVALAVLAFIHEGVAAFATVAVILILWAVPVGGRGPATVITAVPAAVSIAIALRYATGPPGTARAIWSQLEPATRDWLGGTMPNAMLFSEWGAAQVRSLTYQQVVASGDWPVWVLVAVVGVGFTWTAVRAMDPRTAARRHQAVTFLVLVLGGVALSTMAGDIGRWISMVCLLAAVVCLAWTGIRPPEQPAPAPRGLVILAVALAVAVVLVGLPVAGDPRGLPWRVFAQGGG